MRSWRWQGAPAVAGLIALVVATPAAAADLQLSLTSPNLAGTPTVSVVATVPDRLTGVPLPASAFTVSQAGQPLPVAVKRVVDGGAELVLVVDNEASPPVLAAEQAAGVDLLRAMPETLRTTVLPDGSPGSPRQGIETLARLSPGFDLPFLQVRPARGRQLVVVLTECADFPFVPPGLRGAEHQVSVIAVGDGCEAQARDAAGPGGGLVRIGLRPAQLSGAVDEVARRLLGQYVLTTTVVDPRAPLEVNVVAQGVTARGTQALVPPGRPAAVAAQPASGRSGRLGLLTLLAVNLLAVTALGVYALSRRRARLAAAGATGWWPR